MLIFLKDTPQDAPNAGEENSEDSDISSSLRPHRSLLATGHEERFGIDQYGEYLLS